LARHSLSILETIQQYDDFLSSIRHVADLGCGIGEDITWWATLENNNDPPEPYNFNCFAVDNNSDRLAQVPDLKNIHKVHDIYDRQFLFSVSIDLIWAHDSLQYSINPLETIRLWNSYMTVNGMLLLSVPQHTGIEYDRHYSRGYSGCYFHYNPINLIYMLAVNGFDCRDAYLLKKFQDPWINMAVYKTDISPMDPLTTTWYDLIDKNLYIADTTSNIVRRITLEGVVQTISKYSSSVNPNQPLHLTTLLTNGVIPETLSSITTHLLQGFSLNQVSISIPLGSLYRIGV
jgi:SAM-dependent methyltransferase